MHATALRPAALYTTSQQPQLCNDMHTSGSADSTRQAKHLADGHAVEARAIFSDVPTHGIGIRCSAQSMLLRVLCTRNGWVLCC